MVVTPGETTLDPEGPNGENPVPVPLQSVALALDQASVDDWPFGIEVGDAERVTVGGLVCALELTTCPIINNGETSKPSLFRNTEFPNTCTYLDWLELDLTVEI
jgi:hypothetical protein